MPMSIKDRVRAQFGASAENYVSSLHAGGPNLDAMLQAAPLTGAERVLDVGCGPGHTALAFGPRAREVIGLDLTQEMLLAGRRLAIERGVANLRFLRADVESLPYPAEAFDLVTSRFSAHHYPSPDQAVAEVARVLRRGGLFLLVDSISPEDDPADSFLDHIERLRDPSHVRNWRISEWLARLRAAGLDATHLESWTLHLDFADWVRRMNTPRDRVAELETALRTASNALRDRFSIEPDGSWQIPIALLRARRT